MSKNFYYFVCNIFIFAFFTYLQLGSIKLWKRVISINGDISWLYFWGNIALLILISLSIVFSISMYIKDNNISGDHSRAEVPNFQFQLTDNLYDDTELKKPGTILYDGLITLPIGGQMFLKDILINVKFPVIIEKFEIINDIGIEKSKIHLGTDNIFEFNRQGGFKGHSKEIIIEIEKLKPGAFFRFKAFSVNMSNRNINRDIDYNGYFFWDSDSATLKEDISGKFKPKYYKLAEFNLDKWEKLLSVLKGIDAKKDTFDFWTSDPRWFLPNGYFIDFIPSLRKENFEIKIFRDRDNIFKCRLTTYYYKDVLLQFKNIDELLKQAKHPKHMVAITWSSDECRLYIDGKLVDIYPKHKTKK